MTSRAGSLLSAARGASGVAVAMAVMNVTTYGFNLVAVYLVGPREFGVVAALMGVIGVANVLSLGLQATGARHVSSAPGSRAVVEAALIGLSWRSALAVGAACVLLAPVIDRVLGLDDLVAATLVGVAMVPLTAMGGQAGILQGERRWLPLGLVYLAVGVPRFLLGAVAMLVQPTATSAMLGVAVAAWVPALVGAVALGHHTAAHRAARSRVVAEGLSILREIGHNSHALFLFFAISTADVLVAQAVLDDHTAGLYAGAAIVAKAVMFAPQFVVVVSFPSMARAGPVNRVYLTALGAVALLGGLCVLGTWLLPEVALLFAGGSDFAEIRDLLWWFALLGTVFGMLQLMVYEAVARQFRFAAWLLWTCLAAVVLLGTRADDPGSLVRTVVMVDALALTGLLGLAAIAGRGTGSGVRAAPVPPGVG